MNKWISTADRLPMETGRYIVYANITYRNARGVLDTIKMVCLSSYSEWDGFAVSKEVTHWMPLPEPPKEVE